LLGKAEAEDLEARAEEGAGNHVGPKAQVTILKESVTDHLSVATPEAQAFLAKTDEGDQTALMAKLKSLFPALEGPEHSTKCLSLN
jgi:hypothetical protein